MFNISSIRKASLFTKPYGWGLVDNIFANPGEAMALAETFPEEGFLYRKYLGGRYVRRPLLTLQNDDVYLKKNLPDAYQNLVKAIQSDDYRAALSDLSGINLQGAPVEASFWRYDHASILGIHADQTTKMLTHVLYLNPQWHHRLGGRLQILNSQDESDILCEFTPQFNLSAIILPSENSWHNISPVSSQAPDSRNTLTIQFHKPGTKAGRDYY